MDCQCVRKISIVLLLLITLGFAATTVSAAPAEDGSAARHQATNEPSWSSLIQELWEAILSVAGTPPDPAGTNNTPEPPDGDPNLQGGLDPLG